MTTQNKSLRSPFAPTEGGILISSTLHDDEWSAYGDRLLKSSRAASSHDAPDSFTVDLSRCVWADPCPLMSVLLYGNHIARKQATNVTIKVCLAKEVTPTNQFPVFFFKQGFASAIRAAGMTVADNNDNIILPSDDQEYLARDDVLAYPDPPVIRAAILNFNPSPVPSNLVPDFVNTLLDQAREAYDHIAHRSVYTGLFYRTQVVLEETIQNVVDHAYRKSSNTPSLMVFARYRKGFKQLDSTNIATWRASITREQNRCPFLKADYLEDKEGCIEIFVVDHGIGIAGSFEKSARTLDGRQALRTILQRIFTVGKSTKKGKRADAGGLTVIHNQMVPNRDYLRGYDSGTWFGVPGGLNRPNRKIDDHPVDTGETMPVGLAWTLRLGLRGDIAPSLPWPHPIGDCKKSLLSEFERFYQCSGDELTCDVIDSRINIPRLDLFQPTDHKDVVIWLPQPDLGKDDVRTFFDRICARLTSSLRWTIIIADLRTHEGTVFFDALNGTSKPSDAHIDRVCLITERVQLHLLSRRADSKERFEVLDHEEAALVETGVLSPSCNLKDILANLRFHDSKCIWDEINRTPHTYIPEWIKWGVDQENKNKYIFGYLDLEIARHSRVISQLARIGIERVVGLTQGTSDVLLEPVDAFVSDLCDNFNSLGDRYKHADAARAHIGSIFVTGRTIDTMQCGQAKDVFHLLRHPYVMGPQDEEATATVFVWKHEASLPPKPEKDSDIRFERVGTSHAISIKGSKHYTIPKKKNDGTYFAHRSPKELYEDIQRVRASTVRVGHWVYRNNHDILGLNMRLFVRDGFDRRNDFGLVLDPQPARRCRSPFARVFSRPSREGESA